MLTEVGNDNAGAPVGFSSVQSEIGQEAQDHIFALPPEMLCMIFSWTEIPSLVVLRKVCVYLGQIASDRIFDRKIVLHTIAFGNRQWAGLGGQKLIANEDPKEELRDLPNNYGEYFTKYFPGKKMRDTLLVRVLKTHTLDNLGAMAKNCMQTGTENGYDIFRAPDQQGPITRSYWIIVPKEITPGTCGQSYQEQCRIVTAQGLEVPKLVEVVAAMVAHFSLTRECLFPCTYARCQETRTDHSSNRAYQMVVGIQPFALRVPSRFDRDYDCIGVVGSRKFHRP